MHQNAPSKTHLRRRYFTLAELREEWNTTEEHIRYMLENNELKAYLRPALAFFAKTPPIQHITDFQPIPISLSDLCRLLHDKRVVLETDEQTFPATYEDIVVKEIDRCKAEVRHPHLSTSGIQPLVLFSDNWTCFEFRGVILSFGRTQGAVLKHLYQRLKTGNPLMGTKELLDAVGAHCNHINNLFHNKPMWRELIIFPERGYCRLNLPENVKIIYHQPTLFDAVR